MFDGALPPAGSWTIVNGAKKGDSPQVCVLSLFYEDGPGAPSPPQPRRSPQRLRGARRQPPTNTSGGPEPDAPHDSNPSLDPAAGSGPDGGAAGATGLEATAAGWVEAGAGAGHVRPGPHPTTGLPQFGSPGRSPAEDGPFRNFSLSVDVRTFQSSKRLPLSSASVYVQAVLPPEIIGGAAFPNGLGWLDTLAPAALCWAVPCGGLPAASRVMWLRVSSCMYCCACSFGELRSWLMRLWSRLSCRAGCGQRPSAALAPGTPAVAPPGGHATGNGGRAA